jgi:hypothetical protein
MIILLKMHMKSLLYMNEKAVEAYKLEELEKKIKEAVKIGGK